jgi:hypothetical protein
MFQDASSPELVYESVRSMSTLPFGESTAYVEPKTLLIMREMLGRQASSSGMRFVRVSG